MKETKEDEIVIKEYDVVIVGSGIAGCVMAKTLYPGRQERTPAGSRADCRDQPGQEW